MNGNASCMADPQRGGGSSGRPTGSPPEPPPPFAAARSTNHFLPECYLCLRSEVLPMSPAVQVRSNPSLIWAIENFQATNSFGHDNHAVAWAKPVTNGYYTSWEFTDGTVQC